MRPFRLLALLLGFLALSLRAEETAPPGPFAEEQCILCHEERDPGLVDQWRRDVHSAAAGTGCSGCHGDRHEGAAETARRDRNCTRCHDGPAGHSYATSKHGVITRLEAKRRGWRLPSRSGNYRTPGCGYCHYHDGRHEDTMDPAAGPGEVRQWICSQCHSPRYVNEAFAAGRRQLEIADLKVKEGLSLISQAGGRASSELAELQKALVRHRRNVLLGVGHQSPDYQWWHGQPALDGDLIRIRDALIPLGK